ncbi:MAG TPA: hypothetical protein VGX23_27065 [Actinocrinis sp.]|nr:hypothetical protein [Actinocrinis sp.]
MNEPAADLPRERLRGQALEVPAVRGPEDALRAHHPKRGAGRTGFVPGSDGDVLGTELGPRAFGMAMVGFYNAWQSPPSNAGDQIKKLSATFKGVAQAYFDADASSVGAVNAGIAIDARNSPSSPSQLSSPPPSAQEPSTPTTTGHSSGRAATAATGIDDRGAAMSARSATHVRTSPATARHGPAGAGISNPANQTDASSADAATAYGHHACPRPAESRARIASRPVAPSANNAATPGANRLRRDGSQLRTPPTIRPIRR